MALRLKPTAVVVVAGVNDTLRSDYSSRRMHADLDHIARELTAAGASVVTVRFHDQGRMFKLPGKLRRVFKARIDELNRVVDVVVARHGIRCVDLHTLPGAYELEAWAVDRLHPSELGHRMLAKAFAHELTVGGARVRRGQSGVLRRPRADGVAPRRVADAEGRAVVVAARSRSAALTVE